MFAKKKKKEAVKTLRQIAKFNKMSLEDDIELPNIDSEVSSGDVRLMFTSGYTKATLIIWYCWFVNSMVYEAVHFSAPDVGGNLYLNWCLSGISELLSTLVSIYAHNRFGRKRCIIVGEIMAALSTLGAVILTVYENGNSGYLVGKVVLSMVSAKFFIVLSYGGIFLLTAEYYPTLIRNVAHGSSMALSAIGGIVAGYVTHLIRVHPLLPYCIMAGNAMLSAFLCLSLKETNNQPILDVLPSQEEVKEEELTNQPMLDVMPQELKI